MSKRPADKPFEMIAGNVALDLVNTLDFRFRESGPEELLESYGDLLRFLEQAGLLSAQEVRRLRRTPGEAERLRVLEQAKELREAVASVAYALLEEKDLPSEVLATLERYFAQAFAARRLTAKEGGLAWSWRPSNQQSNQLAAPLCLLAAESAEFLLSGQVKLLRSCASDACRWLFLDTSKNHTRRWCDMKICGNRMKARRFQARLATGESPKSLAVPRSPARW
jgi:predicted RNA-binding Zn ribbon-like protein